MPETRRQRLPATARRELVVEAALEEFARAGYDAASMGRVARAAGVTRTVLYDHFPSKRALFGALLQENHATLLSHLRATITAEKPMRERMQATFDAYLAFAESEPLAWKLLFPDHPTVDAEVAADQRRYQSESNRLFAALLAPDAKRAGIEPASAAGQAIFAMHQAALHAAVKWWRAHPNVPRAELTQATMDALWSGLGGLERDRAVLASMTDAKDQGSGPDARAA
jgi:AcrR family transcriptional regulator